MRADDRFGFASKSKILTASRAHWNPNKTEFGVESGIDLIIDRRVGYLLWDAEDLLMPPALLAGVQRRATSRRWVSPCPAGSSMTGRWPRPQ